MELLEWTFYGNTLANWLIALGVAFVSLTALHAVWRVGVRQLEALSIRTETNLDAVVAAGLRNTKGWFLFILAVRAGSLALVLPDRLGELLATLTIVASLLQLAFWVSAGLDRWLGFYTEQRIEEDAAAVTTMRAMLFIGRVALWTVVLLVALDNLGYQVTGLIAGLGVGGIAVALAVQNILGDLFSSLSIVLDRPFVVGDFIIVGEFMGTVEHVGLKTTRLRSLSGEQLVFSNSDLLGSRIRNYKRMQERRVLFELGVTYQTPREKLVRIPEIIRAAIEREELARFDRAHFKAYGNFALQFEVVYYVLQPDFNTYMDIQQAVNLFIHEKFEEEGIEFAYPTQTLFLSREGGRGEADQSRPTVPSPR